MINPNIKRGLLLLVALLLLIAYPAMAVKYATHDNPKITLVFEENVDIIKSTINDTAVSFSRTGSNYSEYYYQSAFTQEGVYSLFVNATGRDSPGYMEGYTEAFILDKTPPRLLSSTPSAGSTVYVENGQLTIRLAFSEKVTPKSSRLTAANGSNISLALSTSGYVVNHSATATVSNGVYVLTLMVLDEAGNNQSFTLSFDIIRALDISLVKPKDGASNSSTVNITVSTNRNANCKYYLNTNKDKSLSTLGESYFTDLLPNGAGTVHSIGRWFSDGSETSVFVMCKGSIGSINLSKREEFKIYVDTTAPKITVQASDITEPPFESDVYIDSDDLVVCRFSEQNVKFDSMERIGGTGIESYIGDYRIIKTVSDKSKHTFYIGCRNKAGATTYASASFVVDTSLPISLEIIKPSKTYHSEAAFAVIAKTTRDAKCSYAIDNSTDYRESGTFGINGKNHTSESISFSQGKHTLYVKCIAELYGSAPVTIIKNKKFYVDTTPPVNFTVSLLYPTLTDGKTYVSDYFRVNASSADPESGISNYLFEINSTETKNYSTGWIDISSVPYSLSKDAKGKGIKINDQTKYEIAAISINNAGLATEPQFLYFFIDRSLRPATCKNKFLDIKNETDIDCGGSCSPCSDGKSCSVDSDCMGSLCKNKICTAPSCFDMLKNGAETDVDCGGLCTKKCIDLQSCKINSDCLSAACSVSTSQCQAFAQYQCTNNAKDGTETDIDCGGGSCSKCPLARACNVDEDCMVGNCEDNKCKTAAPIIEQPKPTICDDPDDFNCNGIPNEWEISHGLDPYDPTSGDQLNEDNITYKQQYLDEQNTDDDGGSKTIYIVLLIILIIICLLVGFYFLQGKEFRIGKKTFLVPIVYQFGKNKPGTYQQARSYQQIYPQQPYQQQPSRPIQQPTRPMQQQPSKPMQPNGPTQKPYEQPAKQYLQQKYSQNQPPNNYQSKTEAYLKKKEKEREDALGNFNDPKV